MNKIELVTQPETDDRVKQTIDQDTLKKLEKLITQEKESPEEQVDFDGFKIPDGKIPLDGHFSTNEIRELVNLAKSEGLLSENVVVTVLESNGALGDKLVIKEENTEEKNDKIDKGDVNQSLLVPGADDNDKEDKEDKEDDGENNGRRKSSVGEDIAKAISEAKAKAN
ncbi:hypothetical protein CLIB1444_09S03488 [[Candida] jaroonii]|uniref:Uncharacterized protein n=1 Tax=[Candida] jaroonii TaxID=467808 RepID=A0ACA9YCG2_9ASCO|nr:hypothetical protein CLIB1444_09S03488 [[Candida] jaroonii]